MRHRVPTAHEACACDRRHRDAPPWCCEDQTTGHPEPGRCPGGRCRGCATAGSGRPRDIAGAVESIARITAPRRRKQPDLVVVPSRSNTQSRCFGQRSDSSAWVGRVVIVHSLTVRPLPARDARETFRGAARLERRDVGCRPSARCGRAGTGRGKITHMNVIFDRLPFDLARRQAATDDPA
jgi:hypothetical protein